VIQQDIAAGLQMVSKKHLKGNETKAGGRCGFWGQTEEGPGGELAHERAGRMSATAANTDQTALIPPMLRTHEETEKVSFGQNSNGDSGREETCQFQTEGEGNNFASYCAV